MLQIRVRGTRFHIIYSHDIKRLQKRYIVDNMQYLNWASVADYSLVSCATEKPGKTHPIYRD